LFRAPKKNFIRAHNQSLSFNYLGLPLD